MSSNILDLIFHADTKELDEAKEKMVDLGKHIPSVGEGLEQLAESFLKLPGPVGLAAAAFVGIGIGLKEMLEHTLEAQVQLLELSEAMGVPVEKLQPFAQAMELSGISGEKLRGTMAKLSQSVGSALSEPMGKAADAFKKLGVSQEELKNGDTEEIMKKAAEGLDKYADSAQKTAVIRDLFGKQGPQVVAAMKSEAEYEALAAEAQRDYGTAISETDAVASKHFGSTLKLGMTMFDGVANSVTKSLVPGLQELVNQFAESGKAGGFMRDMLDAVGATISVVSKVIITMLVEPIRLVAMMFKEAGMTIGAVFAAINAAAHGNLSGANEIINSLGADIQKLKDDTLADMNKFEDSLWNGAKAVDGAGEAAEKAKPKYEGFSKTTQAVANTLSEMVAKLAGQEAAFVGASESMDAYKKVQDEVAISAELAKLKIQGATEAQLVQAKSYLETTASFKQYTAEQVAGQTALINLKNQLSAFTSKNTELEKANAEIQKNSLDTINPQLAEQLITQAKALDTAKQAQEVQKISLSYDQQSASGYEKLKASMSLTTSELALFNAQLKLKNQYDKDIEGKPQAEIDQITAAYERAKQALIDNNTATQNLTQSTDEFFMGASKGAKQFIEDNTNMNKLGLDVTNQLTSGITTAFTNMGSEGKKAFSQLLVSMLQFFEQYIIKLAIAKAMGGMGFAQGGAFSGGQTQTVTAHAQGGAFNGGGGAVTAFAQGGVVDQPTMAPMALFGEAGPEAIMPLTRDASGSLGVKMTGSAGGSTIVNNHSITIHSSQDPHDIAKQVKQQLNMAVNITKKTVSDQQRPGGSLNNHSAAF